MHINIWGCLLYTMWIVAYGVYIGVRAAKTIDRSSSIFAYQVKRDLCEFELRACRRACICWTYTAATSLRVAGDVNSSCSTSMGSCEHSPSAASFKGFRRMLCVGSRGPNDRREADILPSDSHHLHIIKPVTVGSIVAAIAKCNCLSSSSAAMRNPEREISKLSVQSE